MAKDFLKYLSNEETCKKLAAFFQQEAEIYDKYEITIMNDDKKYEETIINDNYCTTISSNNEDCRCEEYKQLINELNEKLEKTQQDLNDFKTYVINEFEKLNIPSNGSNENRCKPGDIRIQDKWLVREEVLDSAARSCGGRDISYLFENVFGEGYFKQFKKINHMDADVQQAVKELIGKFYLFCF